MDHPKCKTTESRRAAFQLLGAVCRSNRAIVQRFQDLFNALVGHRMCS